MSIEVGLRGRAEDVVRPENTAQAACSGALPVYGTPFLCALMEKASWTSIAPLLARARAPWAPGWTSATTRPPPSG